MKNYLFVLLFTCGSIALLTGCAPKPTSNSGTQTSSHADMEEDILSQINQYRRSKGLSALKLNNEISAEAEKHSQRMASGKVPLGHSGFSSRIQQIADHVGHISRSAENVAYGSRNAKEVVTGWINSPGHRQNIEGDFTLTGIGVASNSKGILYFTQIFVRKG
jgi:uncharacterized protein YkwD